MPNIECNGARNENLANIDALGLLKSQSFPWQARDSHTSLFILSKERTGLAGKSYKTCEGDLRRMKEPAFEDSPAGGMKKD